MQIKVMTFNIRHGKGTDGKLDLHRITEAMGDNQADIIGFNEVDRHFSKRSEYTDQLSWLAKRLDMNQAFGATIALHARGTPVRREYGNALLSRYPIVLSENHMIGYHTRFLEGRSLLEINVHIHGQPMKIYLTHLSLNPLVRRKQIKFIAGKVNGERQPVILLGDCNMRPGSREWRLMSGYLTDACHAAGMSPSYTFPSFRPAAQLDYIFVSRNLHIASVEVIKKIPAASDHLPLMATLILKS